MNRQGNALVTGGNKGIGHAIARGLGKRGYMVWLASRDEGRGEAAAEALRAEGVEARALALDVTHGESVRAAAEKLEADTGALDVLVNNAGIPGRVPSAADEPVDEAARIFETNFFGAWRVTQAFLPLLKAAGQADIVMLSSSLGSIARAGDRRTVEWNVGLAGYCCSKTALNMLTAKFARELAGDGIRVNAVNPGHVETELGGQGAPLTVEDGAAVVLTLLEDRRPEMTGAFLELGPAGVPVQIAW